MIITIYYYFSNYDSYYDYYSNFRARKDELMECVKRHRLKSER